MNSPGATGLSLVVQKSLDTFGGPLPDDVIHAAKRCLVDWAGLAIAGRNEEPCRIIERTLSRMNVGGGNSRLPAPFLALVLGTASHVLDYDDTDHVNLIHVSSTLFPALFALGDARNAGGDKLLRAFIAGYEAEDRIGFYLGRKLTARGWHVSGVMGHLGSALSAGLVLDLDEDCLVHAMAISGTAASGLIAAFGTMSKPLQLGRAAADGLVAAHLASEGFSGPSKLLESDPGFGRPFVAETLGNFDVLERDWGNPYALLRNSFKPHASCMITHPIIDAASALRDEMASAGVNWSDIDTIQCRVNPLAPQVAGNPHPKTGLEGKFSIAYCCLLGLIDGNATPDRFGTDALARQIVQDALPRISVLTDPQIGEQQAEVTLRTRSGAQLVRHVAMAKGNPANPLTDEDLSQKFMALAEPVLGRSAKAALQRLWTFEKEPDACAWFERLTQPAMAA